MTIQASLFPSAVIAIDSHVLVNASVSRRHSMQGLAGRVFDIVHTEIGDFVAIVVDGSGAVIRVLAADLEIA
jgi:hypothetical protein